MSKASRRRAERAPELALKQVFTGGPGLKVRQTVDLHSLEDLTHDVRTPLTTLQLALDQLLCSTPTPTKEQAELLSSAIEEVNYLGFLMELMVLSIQPQEGLEPPARKPRADLGAIVERVAWRGRILGRSKSIAVESARPDLPVWVAFNPILVERMVSNLVRNAIEHGEAGGHVALSVEESQERSFELVVLDDGKGVPLEQLPRLTARGFRASSARDEAGQGLGLAIVEELCHRAGWTLKLELQEPRGLKVTLSGPIEQT